MSFTLTYISPTVVRVTPVSATLVVKVDKMNSQYAYDEFVEETTITVGNTLDITYSEDGVYKYTITEGVSPAVYYCDVSYYRIRLYITDYLKTKMCSDCNNCTQEELYYFNSLSLNSLFYFNLSVYNLTDVTDFSNLTVIQDLKDIYDAIIRNNSIIETLIQLKYVSEQS